MEKMSVMYTLTQYLQTLENPDGLCHRLEGFTLCRHADGHPIYHIGNSAILFKIQLHGRTLRLRCYTQRPARNLSLLYGESLLERELYLYQGAIGEWVDVVVEEWIEGENLEQVMVRAAKAEERHTLHHLSAQFEQLASELLQAPWAHGDLKPENIVVGREGELQLIDFDGCYLPEEPLKLAPELGTPAWQHPTRGNHYDAWLDHYPATLMAVQLRALALDPTLIRRFPRSEGILFHPEEVTPQRRNEGPLCEAYRAVCTLFASQGDAVHYRLARLLLHPDHRLPDCEELLGFRHPLRKVDGLEIFFDRRLAGFKAADGYRTPLLYDEAFDFREGWALIRLGEYRHYIDRTLRVVHTLPATCSAAKSRRNGRIRYRIEEKWYEEEV